MNIIEAILLGIIQGLTEFLPVSSSGHIELGKYIFDINLKDDLLFSLILHLATVLSTIIIFRKDIIQILKDLLKFSWNNSVKFVSYILVSMLPVLMVGLFFKDWVEAFFNGNIVLVGSMLLLTGLLLLLSEKIKPTTKPLGYSSAFIIGIAQAIAVLPGISRSGATIATGLLQGVNRNSIARFSFLMVIPPIVGASLLDISDIQAANYTNTDFTNMALGFFAAFLTGLLACKLMIRLVKNSKLLYFAIYCFIVGTISIAAGLYY